MKTLAQTNNFIVLDNYKKIEQNEKSYQSEYELEKELIKDLQNQGYEFLENLNTPKKLLNNAKIQLEKLNNIKFNDNEWKRFLDEYLDKTSDTIIEKTRKIHDDDKYDFIFDSGEIKNIYLLNKKNPQKNTLQVIKQFTQKGKCENRYDVTILINGLPLVQIELKKRGTAIKEAFNQIHRYTKESFNSEHSLYKFTQIFIISNGTDTRYFANTTKRDKNSFDFTINWADAKNNIIQDLKDFTATFLEKKTLLDIIIKYCIFDTTNTLLIMRPYQIAATERILWKIQSSYQNKIYSKPESGGYIWHATGSGKTITSFKAARLATNLDFIDKVFFVVDRKDLDYQTIKEYQRFSPDSVNRSNNTAELKANILKNDNKIIVTTIQKLNNLIKSEDDLEIYNKQALFMFDECHRSQFGEVQKNIRKKFKKYYQFGFTGTPIFSENALIGQTTASVFGRKLHSYVITDAIRDEKVLKFKVDYNDVRPKFKSIETEQNEEILKASETKQALLHPERISEISKYILNNFNQKTHRLNTSSKGFNAMFAVSNIEAAKLYYEKFKELQNGSKNPLKIATIFSYAANEEQNAKGEIEDEGFELDVMNLTAKEYLSYAIDDYNEMFKTNYSVDSKEFQNYYRDVSKRTNGKDSNGNDIPDDEKIDLLIVVGMFLTGFNAPRLNTLFVDKNLRYHGLIQAYSRTNRIYDSTKTFGNIITFRDLEKATTQAIALFGDNAKNIILEKSYDEYMNGFKDESKRGFLEVVNELKIKFPDPSKISLEKDKKEFVKLFGEYLKLENILQNYDEFTALKEFQNIDLNNTQDLKEFKERFYLTDDDIDKMKDIKIPSLREIQDYKSTYNDIKEWRNKQENSENKNQEIINWNDVVFEIELLKSQEINLDYILELIFEQNKDKKDKNSLIDEARRLIKSSLGQRAKEDLIIDFINSTNLDIYKDKADLIDGFYKYAREIQKKEANELIKDENLKEDLAKRYIKYSLERGFADDRGMELNEILPKMSPLNPNYLNKKQGVLQKIIAFVEKFKGVGGSI
ncbi:type I restriction endonuclease subunit R [Campylobacter sp. FMV-PI01]|uniref:Type I restriction enzyme endonuclease subunit n=1 Tax=Campylobacter portucalensis TaxID=2608384 RepID=A0A6L5WFM0_9BACT|nr:type I restriction endonuclease subunit R [Campylobacter portucalensis]MSN95870.1 type I restriction endonuclease subunit R [Campylobacter portucalensis]